MPYAQLAGTGSYLPPRRVSNDELAAFVDTSDAWIAERTGIRARHLAAAEQRSSDLAVIACQRALAAAGTEIDEVDLIVLATTTPDMIFPSTASLLQAKLGMKRGAAFDVQAVCAGYVYALSVADNFIRAGQSRCALVVGAETMSRLLDWQDRRVCILFGDGAGACVLRAAETPGILSTHLHSDGRYADILKVDSSVYGGALLGDPYIRMQGKEVFKVAVRVLGEVAHEALQSNGLNVDALDWLVPHQANLRIIEATAQELGLPMSRVITTVAEHGNTSAASIPLALDNGLRDGRIRSGQTVLLEGVGGGMAWGSALLRI